jgi:hypothetical protein
MGVVKGNLARKCTGFWGCRNAGKSKLGAISYMQAKNEKPGNIVHDCAALNPGSGFFNSIIWDIGQ